MQKIQEAIVAYTVGFVGYTLIEVIWRGFTHPSMSFTGGACFLLFYLLIDKMPHLTLNKKCILGAFIITAIEFVVGCVVNIKWGLNVWDYKDMPANLYGQICLPYSLMWYIITIPMCFISDFISGRRKIKSIAARRRI